MPNRPKGGMPVAGAASDADRYRLCDVAARRAATGRERAAAAADRALSADQHLHGRATVPQPARGLG